MDTLSPEIMDMILDLLIMHDIHSAKKTRQSSNPPRKPFGALWATLALISRPWQYVVEHRSFFKTRIQGTPEGIARFATIYSKPWRQAALQWVYFDIPYFCSCDKRAVDTTCRHKRDAHVGAMTALYRCMETWEAARIDLGRIQPHMSIQLDVSRKPFSDQVSVNAFAEKNMALWKGSEAAKWIFQLRSVNTPDIVAACQFPTFLSNLEYLTLKLPPFQGRGGLAKYGEQHLVNLHKTLTEALLDARTSLPHLKTLYIDMGVNTGIEEHESPPAPGFDLRNADGVDELCEAIRLLSQSRALLMLTLKGILVSPDLFQDCRLPAGEHDTTTWPLLEDLEITYPAMAPSGAWYLKNDPELAQSLGDVDDDQTQLYGSDWWQSPIDSTTFDPLQEAFARAVLRMPSLNLASFELECSYGLSLYVGAVDRPKGATGRMNILETPAWRNDEQEWESASTDEESDGMDEDESAAAAEAAKMRRIEAYDERKRAYEALMLTDRAIEIDSCWAGGYLYFDEEISRKRPWNPESVLREDALWRPTAKIAGLWMKWARGEGRGNWS